MLNKTTTDLEELRKNRFSNFAWGTVLQTWDIEEYTIVKYQDKIGDKNVCYHMWLDGKDTNRSTFSLEEAIIDVIAIKYDGINSYAGIYFSKMIGLNKKEE